MAYSKNGSEVLIDHLSGDVLDALMVCIDYGVVCELVLHEVPDTFVVQLLEELIRKYRCYADIGNQVIRYTMNRSLCDNILAWERWNIKLQRVNDAMFKTLNALKNNLKQIDDEQPEVCIEGVKRRAKLRSKDRIHMEIARAICRLTQGSVGYNTSRLHRSIASSYFNEIIKVFKEYDVISNQVLESKKMGKNDFMHLITAYLYLSEVYLEHNSLELQTKEFHAKKDPLSDADCDKISDLMTNTEAASINKAATLRTIVRLLRTINCCVMQSNTSEYKERVHYDIAKTVSNLVQRRSTAPGSGNPNRQQRAANAADQSTTDAKVSNRGISDSKV